MTERNHDITTASPRAHTRVSRNNRKARSGISRVFSASESLAILTAPPVKEAKTENCTRRWDSFEKIRGGGTFPLVRAKWNQRRRGRHARARARALVSRAAQGGLRGGRLGGILAPSRITGPQSISAHYSRGPARLLPPRSTLKGTRRPAETNRVARGLRKSTRAFIRAFNSAFSACTIDAYGFS